jgi:hypothetical protein
MQGFSDSSYNNFGGHGFIPSAGDKAVSSNDRGSLIGAFHGNKGKDNELVLFSGSGIGGRLAAVGTDGLGQVDPDSFSERCSSINNDDRAHVNEYDNFKIGKGGIGDSDEDVRLYRDIEIRLKIEPLSVKLLTGINDRIRSHLHAQGKPAFANLIGLLSLQAVRLAHPTHKHGGQADPYQSRT